MKMQIKLFGQTIPLEIDEEKVPALLDKFFPAAARAMGQAKELGVDLAPAIQRFIGGSTAVAAPVAEQKLPPEGSVLDHTGAIVPLSNIVDAVRKAVAEDVKKNQVRECVVCAHRHRVTMNADATAPLCRDCLLGQGRPNFTPLQA